MLNIDLYANPEMNESLFDSRCNRISFVGYHQAIRTKGFGASTDVKRGMIDGAGGLPQRTAL